MLFVIIILVGFILPTLVATGAYHLFDNLRYSYRIDKKEMKRRQSDKAYTKLLGGRNA
jgi:hypothetical protein